MNWIEQNYIQIALVISAAILISVGRGPLLPHVRSSRFMLWLAFLVTAVCGLVLGYALAGVMGWVTGLGGIFGGTVASVGAVLAVLAGWWSIDMLVALVRDIADGTPDDEARRAALWFPTMAPAGLSAAWGIVTNPRGLGTAVTALIMAGITVAYCVKISGGALKARKGSRGWKWFAALVRLLGGVVLIPLVAFADAQAAQVLPTWVLYSIRIVLGTLALALLVASAVDIKDKVPDRAVRAFALIGVPLLFLFGVLAWGALSDAGMSGSQYVIGGSLR